MGRGAQWAAVHEVAEWGVAELLTHTNFVNGNVQDSWQQKQQGVRLTPELSKSRSGLCSRTNASTPVWGPSDLEALGFFQIPVIFKNYHLTVSTSTCSKGIFSGEHHYYDSGFAHLSTFQDVGLPYNLGSLM